mgnify:CR=1 FL=1|tara:strand:- start:2132 stop:2593 length:462 start_codon:yes stop_codon:yes gene_type:complete
MARAQSQFLKIYDSSGIVYSRWQNYYSGTVTWQAQPWQNVSFSAEGVTEGVNGEESDIEITATAVTAVVQAFERAIVDGRFAELTVYQFDVLLGNLSPQATQQLVAQYTGQVVGGGGGLTEVTLQLGPAAFIADLQIPSRKLTTAIIGQGCVL